jgi:ribonuclease P protein component
VGNAVARNRARRRLKAVADQLLPALSVVDGDYVLIGRQETLQRPFALLLQDFATALKRVGAIRGDERTTAPPTGRDVRREVR